MSELERDKELRLRYLDLLLPALRQGATSQPRGPAPTWKENRVTWNR